MDIEDAKPGARIIERHKQATAKTVVKRSSSRGEDQIVVEGDNGRTSRINVKNIKRYNLLAAAPADPEQIVVLSRDKTHGQSGRTFAVMIGNGRNAQSTDVAKEATRFYRKDAQDLLDSGRWYGLNPALEPVS